MYVDKEIKDSIGYIWLNRPRTNSLSHTLLEELLEAVTAFDAENEITAVVLSSRLPFGFSGGLDLGSFYVSGEHELTGSNVYKAVYLTFQINRKIVSSDKILIAVLSGPVIGSAASIAFSCDIRIADSGAWFWLPDPQYGGLLADGGLEMLTRHIGNSRACTLADSLSLKDISIPSIRGILTSVSTMSGQYHAAISRALIPSSACSINEISKSIFMIFRIRLSLEVISSSTTNNFTN